MDRTQFLDLETAPWWLIETNVDFDLEDQRNRLSEVLGWHDSLWFTDLARLTELYELIERLEPALLAELDYTTDPAKQLEWMQRLIAVISRRAAEPGSHAGEGADGVAPPPPSSGAAESAAATTVAAAKKSIFAKKRPAEGTADAAEVGADAAEPAAAEAAEAAAEAGAADAATAPEQVEEVLANLAAEVVASLAEDLKMDASQLQTLMDDEEFQRMVAEELAGQE